MIPQSWNEAERERGCPDVHSDQAPKHRGHTRRSRAAGWAPTTQTRVQGVGLSAWVLASALIGFAHIGVRAAEPAGAELLVAQARASVVVISQTGRYDQTEGVGTGFVVGSNGLVATALHVIGEGRPFTVTLADGQQPEVLGIHAWDRGLDLAVVQIDAAGLPALPLGDSDALAPGAALVAIGNPLGLTHSVAQGVLSAHRQIGHVPMLQIAIPLEPGHSGGPVLDRRGQVQGILTRKSALTPSLGFAIPINALKRLLDRPNPVLMAHWLRLNALDPTEWKPVFGARWRPRGNGLEVDGWGSGFSGRALCLWQKPVPPPPFELAVRVRLEEETGAAGLVFCADGRDRHYGFYPSGGYLRLTRFEGPTTASWSLLRQVYSPHYLPGQWNHLKVRREKARIRCYVNGQLVIETTDTGLPTGQVGLAKYRDTRAWFNDFQVGVRLPDPGPPTATRAAIDRRLRQNADASAEALEKALQPYAQASWLVLNQRALELENQADRLRRVAQRLHEQAVLAQLLEAFQRPEPEIDLAAATLLVCKLDHPDLDVPSYLRRLDAMAAELRSQLPTDPTPAVRLAVLTNYLFSQCGFHGSRIDEPASVYLDHVLDDREGQPLTLTVLVVELGRRAGLTNLVPVSLSGRFVVQVANANGTAQLLDPFDAGRPLSPAEAARLAGLPEDQTLNLTQLRPAPKREIIIRLLRTLLNFANRSGSDSDALRYLEALVALAPDSALDRLGRASLRLQTGDTAGAKADFEWLLQRQPPGLDLNQVRRLYEALF